jgi:F-type H+-transporting ATPase subunit b
VITLDLAFFIQIINFGILVLVLNFALYKPIRTMLAQRRQEIESARERALSVDQQVGEKVAEYELRLRDAKAEVGAKRSDLMKEAQAAEASLLEKARSEATASLAALRTRVAKESVDARSTLQQKAESLSSDICEKILGRSL